jgi:hypothetical protein
MISKYQSGKSVAKNPTISITVDDPRVDWKNIVQTQSRQGSEIEIIGLDGKSLITGGLIYTNTGSVVDTGGITVVKPVVKIPGAITDLSAEWQEIEGLPALVFSFNIDLTSLDNSTVDSFSYTLSDGTNLTPQLISTKINRSSSSQQVLFYYSDNTKYFGLFQTTFAEFKVSARDITGGLGPEAVLTDIPTYTPDLCTPTITVTSVPMGYSVTLTDVCTKPYEFLSVEEIVSDSGSAPTNGYQQVYLNKITPANILTPTTAARWVKARYTSGSGLYGSYSNAVKVTPTNPISADLIPPNEVSQISASWSGDNIVVNYKLPEQDAGARIQIELTAPNSSVGYFYKFPDGSGRNQTATITKADLLTQFGEHYSSFSGVLRSIDTSDNRSPGVGFTIATRANPLVGIIPTFTTTALVNGYSVSYTLPAGAVYAEVYQKYTSWSGVTAYDSFTGVYASGGASGSNTVTLSSIISNKGVSVSPLVGYIVVGTGIPENTYITSVSGSQITLNNNFTSQVSGSITGYGIVYSGTSPANISSTIYQNTYLLIRYYDDFENPSSYSAEQIVVPLSPVTVDTTGPGNVSQTGMSTDAGIDTSGTLGFNGYINLSWAAVTETSLRGYRIRFTTDTSNPVYSHVDYPIDQANIPTGTLSYKLQGLAVGATYKIGIATYDQYNNTSTDYISFTDTTISGTPAITDYITAGGFQFGQGVDPTNSTGITGTKRGVFLDDSNYWFLNSADSARLKVGGSTDNYLLWDGQDFTIDGNIIAQGGEFAGNVALTTTGASIYSGDVTTSPGNLTGDGFIFNRDGLLIRKGTNQVSLDTTNGAITANAGNIADWVIAPSKIEKLDSTSGKYAGLSSTGLYKFWSGSTSAGGDTTQFAVDRTGRVFASNVQISGGGIDIGALPTNLTSGFHVTSAGKMYATAAEINGNIEATSGKIKGNFQVESGTFYTGTSPTETSVLINDKGLASIGSSNVTLTAILNTPISSGVIPIGSQPSVGTLPNAISFFTQAALIGGWVVDSTTIKDRSQQFVLDSTNKNILITGVIDVSTNFRVELGTGANVFSAGIVLNGVTQTPTVSITRAGVLTANSAIIRGTVEASGGFFGTSGGTRWTINSTGIEASGAAKIDLSSGGFITVGDYQIKSSSTDFTVTQISNGLNLIKTESVSGATEDPLRMFLGDTTRQVEVAKSAQISGNGTSLQFGANTTATNAYRSGGLRNMYTVSVGNASSAIYPSAVKGDMLLIYDPTDGL